MQKSLRDSCLEMVQPLILQSFDSKASWKHALIKIANLCNQKANPSLGFKACVVNRCVDNGIIYLLQQDEETFKVASANLYELYQKDLYVWLIVCGCKDEEIAKDIVQDIYCEFLKKTRDKGFHLTSASLKVYLCAAVRNKWLTYIRGEPPIDIITDTSGESFDVEDTNPPKPRGEAFKNMRSFVELYRKVFPDPSNNCLFLLKLAILEMKSYKDILAIPSVYNRYNSIDALTNRISKCKKEIRKMLEEEKGLKNDLQELIEMYWKNKRK